MTDLARLEPWEEHMIAEGDVVAAARVLVNIEDLHLANYILGPREQRDGRTKVNREFMVDFVKRRMAAIKSLRAAVRHLDGLK